MMKTLLRPIALLAALLCLARPAAAQNDRRIAEQRKVIESLEQRIAAEEAQIAKLKKGRSATEERARRLAKQIEARNQLLVETEGEATLLREEIRRTDSLAGDLTASLDRNRALYRRLAQESYRSYRQNGYLSYVFSARSFADVARRLAALREMAALRERKLREIAEQQTAVRDTRARLDDRHRSLDSVMKRVTVQRRRLQNDAEAAKREIRSMSQRERSALQRKLQQEQQLSVAIDELRKLTKGNREGASFTGKTAGLNLPVAGGSVKRYKGNMAEIGGPKGAAVRSIYEGKVVEIKRNRITAKYDVFVAHGEYITSYANLGSVTVERGAKVAKNQRIGTIGASVNALTMEPEYKIVFGIYSPDPKETMSAAACFRK